MQVEKCEPPDFLAAVSPKEIDEPVSRRDICTYGMSASAPIVSQIASPTRRKRASRMPLSV